MSKIKIIIPSILIAIIIIGIATGRTKFSDFFSTGDEFYEDIYEAYENSEDIKIDDRDKIATFDFDNFAFILHYLNDDLIEVNYFEKEKNMYRCTGEGFDIDNSYICDEFGGYTFSYNGSSIEFDIVTSDAIIPEGYTSEVIKLKNNENAQFVYKLS